MVVELHRVVAGLVQSGLADLMSNHDLKVFVSGEVQSVELGMTSEECGAADTSQLSRSQERRELTRRVASHP